jgi:hypothetical protein
MSSQQDHATINDKNAYHNRYKLPIRHSSLHILQKESNSQKCHRIPLTEATLLSTNTQAFFPPRIASRLKEWWARALLACRSPHDDLLNILIIIILVPIAVLNIINVIVPMLVTIIMPMVVTIIIASIVQIVAPVVPRAKLFNVPMIRHINYS